MLELLKENPWLILTCMALLIPIFGIIFGTTTTYLTKAHQATLEASLKEQMLQRGMSAEEIKMVIEATPRRGRKHCSPESGMRQEMS